MLSKIFKKRNITSRTIGDSRQTVGIPFRTYMGGITTAEYQIEEEVQQVNCQLREQIDRLIQSGTIDEFTNPDIFDRLVGAQFTLCHNFVEKKGIHHAQVIQSIHSAQQSEMLINMREAEAAAAIINEPVKMEHIKGDKEVERYERNYEKITER